MGNSLVLFLVLLFLLLLLLLLLGVTVEELLRKSKEDMRWNGKINEM